MKIFTVNFKPAAFEPLWHVPCRLIIAANNKKEAAEIAAKTITHTEIRSVKKIKIDEPTVVFYQSGNY